MGNEEQENLGEDTDAGAKKNLGKFNSYLKNL